MGVVALIGTIVGVLHTLGIFLADRTGREAP